MRVKKLPWGYDIFLSEHNVLFFRYSHEYELFKREFESYKRGADKMKQEQGTDFFVVLSGNEDFPWFTLSIVKESDIPNVRHDCKLIYHTKKGFNI